MVVSYTLVLDQWLNTLNKKGEQWLICLGLKGHKTFQLGDRQQTKAKQGQIMKKNPAKPSQPQGDESR